MMRRFVALSILFLVCFSTACSQQASSSPTTKAEPAQAPAAPAEATPAPAPPPDPAADAAVKRVTEDPHVVQAFSILDRDHDKMVADIVSLTEIPSPPFKEDKRGAAYLAMFR